MLTPNFWVWVVAGACALLCALSLWVRGQRRRSLAVRGYSLFMVGVALCQFLLAGGQLAKTSGSVFWLALELAVLLSAVCGLVIFTVYAAREDAQRGAEMQRYRP